MAEGKSRYVSGFLQAVAEKRFSKAADMFIPVADEVVADKPLSSIEQHLQLNPTKAYKKLTRLLKNESAVRGLFQTLLGLELQDTPAMIRAIRFVCSSRNFAKQIASCSMAVDALHQYGTRLSQRTKQLLSHTPALLPPERPLLFGCLFYTRVLESLLFNSQEFAEGALARGYLPLIEALFPFAGPIPGPAERERADALADLALGTTAAFSNLVANPPHQLERIVQSAAAPDLMSWLTRFFKWLHAMMKAFPDLQREHLAANPVLTQNSLHEATHSLLFNLFTLCGTAQRVQSPILDGEAFEKVNQCVRDLTPLLGEHDRKNAEVFLSEGERYKMGDPGLPDVPSDLGTVVTLLHGLKLGPSDPIKAVNDLTSRLVGLSNLENKILIGAGIVDALVGAMMSELRRVHGARGGPVDLETCLGGLGSLMELGFDLGDILAKDARKVASQLVADFELALSVLANHSRHLFLRLLVFCFYKGEIPPADWPKYSKAVVAGISRELLDGVAVDKAWHFLAVLFGAREWFDPEMVCNAFAWSGRTRRPTHAAHRVSSFVSEREARTLIEYGLAWIEKVSHPHGLATALRHEDREEDAAEVIFLCCTEYPALVQPVLMANPRLELFTKLLTSLSERLAADFKRGLQGEPMDEAKEKGLLQSVCLLAALLRLFGLARDSAQLGGSARDTFLLETARDGGILLCRNVRKICQLSSYSSSSLPSSLKSIPDEGLKSEGAKLWTLYEAKFNLKPCSNKACIEDVVEVRQKTFNLCSVCHQAQYCSRSCQRADWKSHKTNCQKVNGNRDGTEVASDACDSIRREESSIFFPMYIENTSAYPSLVSIEMEPPSSRVS